MTRMKITRKGYCPTCETEREIEQVRAREKVNVRGQEIEVEVVYWRCLTCGEEFEGPGGTHDEVAEAYRVYRAKKGLLQPKDIKALRENYGLTQVELAQILGFGAITLSRYENGMLQSAAHDRMLQTVRDPRAFWVFLHRLGDQPSLSVEKLSKLREKLRKVISSSELLDPILEAALDYGPNHLSGHRRFKLEKFVGAILFFCRSPQWKTKINKLLFYADFMCFRDYSRSITGAQYAHAPFGPCPDKFDHLFAWLAERRDVKIEEVACGSYTGEEIRAVSELDLSIFTADEMKILTTVKEKLGRKTAKALSDLSHRERGYKETNEGELISYGYAKHLQI